MKYVDEFRDRALATKLASQIAREALGNRDYHFMEFCGGHTHAIFRYGVQDLMPDNVHFVHGPGCPVYVLPIRRLDDAVELAERNGAILCTYGDMMRVPGTRQRSLMRAKADGADIRMVYSTLDALNIARDNPGREVIFFAIGFETTTPPTAVAILRAESEGLDNFSVFCNHVLTSAAAAVIAGEEERRIVLSGGVMQNRLLADLLEEKLASLRPVLRHSQAPANDGGLALGQAVIAASIR